MVVGVVLYAEESLRGVVSLHVVHLPRRDYLLILLAVWLKCYAAMEEDLKVWPHVLDVLLARQLQHPHEHAQHPRWHARYVGHVLAHALTGYAVALQLEVGEQGGALLGHAEEVDHGVDVLYQYG